MVPFGLKTPKKGVITTESPYHAKYGSTHHGHTSDMLTYSKSDQHFVTSIIISYPPYES